MRAKPYKVALIYPPAEMRNGECFMLPNLSLPVLAYFLKRKGIATELIDLDVVYHKNFRGRDARIDPLLLNNTRLVRQYLNGRLKGAEARKMRDLETALFEMSPIGKADIYGFSLVGIFSRFPVNACALLANRIKKVFGDVPVVIGSKSQSRDAYKSLLREYPVFGFAVIDDGGAPLAGLVDYLKRKDTRKLVRTLARDAAGRIHLHNCNYRAPGKTPGHVISRPELCGSDYDGYPLNEYVIGGKTILSAYPACNRQIFNSLCARHGSYKQLIVPGIFETTCSGQCAFCGAVSNRPSDRRTLRDILAELEKIKDSGVTGIVFLNSNFNDDYHFAEKLCDEIIARKLNLQWCDCVNFRKLDEKLLLKMRDSGAVRLTFGLETGSNRLLRYINKGVTRERASRLLRFSNDIGIWNHVDFIAGLPTENDQDISETTGFIKEHEQVIDEHALGSFYLHEGSLLCRDPEKFGIRIRQFAYSSKDVLRFNIKGLETMSFDEINGLVWEDKVSQIEGSVLALVAAIEKISPPAIGDVSHINLLMYLYHVFGHSRKPLIRKVFRLCTQRYRPYNTDGLMFPHLGTEHLLRRIREHRKIQNRMS